MLIGNFPLSYLTIWDNTDQQELPGLVNIMYTETTCIISEYIKSSFTPQEINLLNINQKTFMLL